METSTIILLLFFILTPVLIIYLEGRYTVVKKIGAVMICYGLGIILGNTGILPDSFDRYQDILTTATVPVALPLILFSLNVRKWLVHARSALLSLALGLFTVILMIVVGYLIFGDKIDESWKVSGMLVGIYTGGTPNLAAMKTALDVDQELYIMTHTYEVFLGAVYLIFILSIGQKVFLLFLRPFKKPEVDPSLGDEDLEDKYGSYKGIFNREIIWPLLLALLLALAILGTSFFVSTKFFKEDSQTAAIILLITTFGIGLSFVPRINKIEKTFQGGMYIILIFCLVVASMADIRELANISFSLFWFVGLAMFGSHILHALLAKVFKMDADTVIISGSALICSPPFVPVVAGALKNKEVILTGLVVGIAGYAVGNYLGVTLAYLLR